MILKLSSVMCVPLLERGNLLGVIYVGNDSVAHLFDESHARGADHLRGAGVADRPQRAARQRAQARQPAARRSSSSRCASATSSARAPAMQEVFSKVAEDRDHRHLGAHHRRDRHRQGADRARDPPPLGARQGPVHHHQLRRDSREPARERAVRSRQGRVHRRGRQQAGQVPGGRRRHPLPRRDRRDAARPAGQAPARAAGEGRGARRRHPARAGRHPHPRRDQPRPRGGDQGTAASARISTTGSTWSTSTCRRCASAATT